MDLEREETQNKFEIDKQLIGDIKFENVSFRYGSRIEVFKNFNAVFKKNETTAIVGESGSGKTTLISLLQNFKLNFVYSIIQNIFLYLKVNHYDFLVL